MIWLIIQYIINYYKIIAIIFYVFHSFYSILSNNNPIIYLYTIIIKLYSSCSLIHLQLPYF